MAQFQLYNYQFGRIENPDETSDLFGQKKYIMSAEESFPKRQDIFQEIFNNDYAERDKNTIVEKDENNILRLIKAAEQFSEERFLEGIKLKRYDIRILYTVETCLGCVSFLL